MSYGTNVADGASVSLSGLRRYARASILVEAFVLVAACLVTLALGEPGVVGVLALVAVLGAATVQRTRWLMPTIPGAEPVRFSPVSQGAVLAAASLAWPYASALELPGATLVWGLLPGAVLSAIVAGQRRARWRTLTVIGAIGCAALAAIASALTGTPPARIGETTAIVLAITLGVVALELVQVWYIGLAVQLDEARRTSGALAVAEERLRFAADLHDTQGHYLEVIALKGDLVERLAPIDGAQAAAHAAEIGDLARQALSETRGLVRGYRQTSLRVEVENALRILQATSMTATLDGDPDAIPHELQPMFGALVREGTTNVLRHSDATLCRITVTVDEDAVELRLVNDRPRRRRGMASGPGGSGLAGLRERFAAVGGVLHTSDDTEYAVVGRVPATSKVGSA